MKFTTTIVQMGNNTGIDVPPEVVEALGAGKKPPVKITLKGYTYRSSIAVMGSKYMVSLSAENRKNAGVQGGDTLDVEIVVDTEKREITVPPDLQAALDANPEAKAFFEKMSYSNKRRHVEPIEAAKAPETRQRRIEKSVQLFSEGKV
jgi:antitoxin component of MazEF toxin-antitoxin module